MATLAELVADVYTLTKRPDLIDRTKLAVRAATLKLHQRDFFAKDIMEFGVSFSAAAVVQSFEYKRVQPRWRAAKYFRKTNVVGMDTGEFFEIITPEEILDSYQINRSNVCYLAGSVFQLRSSEEFQYMFCGCYVNPDTTEASFSSWIADERPYAIVYDAAASIFKSIGADEEEKAHRQLAMEQVGLLVHEVMIQGL